jgi:anti-sigma regulatory factor (Ser/Thr protein kinase)
MGLTVPYFAAHRVAPALETPRQARRFTLHTLDAWGVLVRTPDVVAVASELATNAVRHALTDPKGDGAAWLGLSCTGGSVVCAVTDPSPTPPVLRPQAPEMLNGRGLRIIEALTDRWGYTVLCGTGKVVWAQVAFRPLATAQKPTRPEH